MVLIGLTPSNSPSFHQPGLTLRRLAACAACMKIDTKSRLPLFELSMILAVALIVYAAWQLHQLEPRFNKEQQRLVQFEQQSTNLHEVLDDMAEAFTNELTELHRSPMKVLDLRLEALNAKSEYNSIAQRLTPSV